MVERRGAGAGRAEAEDAAERGRVDGEEVEERGQAEAAERGREEAEEAEEQRPADSVARMPKTSGMPTCEKAAGWSKTLQSPPVGLADHLAAHEGRRRKGWSGAAPGAHAGASAGLRHQREAGEARI